MPPGTLGEVWRLHNHAGIVTTCKVTAEPDGYLLVVQKNGIEVLSEQHRSSQAAFARAETVRQELVAQGWSGVFPRTP